LSAPLLEVSDLNAWYGQAQALHGVSLTVNEGECVALIGRNGAGKTTTLRSIMGVLRKKTGSIKLRGHDITRLDSHQIARKGVAYVPEERAIFATLTVKENLELPPVWNPKGWSSRKCTEAFPALRLAREAAVAGGTAPCVLNAANEIAVYAFLAGRLPFLGIAAVIEDTLARLGAEPVRAFESLYEADREARAVAGELVESRVRS